MGSRTLEISNQIDYTTKKRCVCVWGCVCGCVFVLREQEPFNHRKATCSTSLHCIHHHSPVLLDPSIFNPSFLIPPTPPLARHPNPPTPFSLTHTCTHTPSNDFLLVKHATEAKLLLLRIYNPKGSGKKATERTLYKARGSQQLTSGWSLHSAFCSQWRIINGKERVTL